MSDLVRPDGFSGTFDGLALPDLLQMLHHGHRSVVVQVELSDPSDETSRQASIHMRDGEIIHASAGELSGRHALFELLRSPSGSITTSPLGDCPSSLALPFDALLIDVMREIDEAARDGRAAPSDQAHGAWGARPDQVPSKVGGGNGSSAAAGANGQATATTTRARRPSPLGGSPVPRGRSAPVPPPLQPRRTATLQDALESARAKVKAQAARAREAALRQDERRRPTPAMGARRLPTGPVQLLPSAPAEVESPAPVAGTPAEEPEESTAATVAAPPAHLGAAGRRNGIKRKPTPSHGPNAVYDRQRPTPPRAGGASATPQPEFGRLITGPHQVQPQNRGPLAPQKTGPLPSAGAMSGGDGLLPQDSAAGYSASNVTPSPNGSMPYVSVVDEASAGRARFRAFALGVIAAILIFIGAFAAHWLLFREPPARTRATTAPQALPSSPLSAPASSRAARAAQVADQTSASASPSQTAETPTQSREPVSVVVSTNPADLELIRADSRESLGRSPILLRIGPSETIQLRARLGSRVSSPFAVDADSSEALDLRSWVKSVRRRRSNGTARRRAARNVAPPEPTTAVVQPAPQAPKKQQKPLIRTLDESEPATGLLEDDVDPLL